jgi:hypothetical protein
VKVGGAPASSSEPPATATPDEEPWCRRPRRDAVVGFSHPSRGAGDAPCDGPLDARGCAREAVRVAGASISGKVPSDLPGCAPLGFTPFGGAGGQDQMIRHRGVVIDGAARARAARMQQAVQVQTANPCV